MAKRRPPPSSRPDIPPIGDEMLNFLNYFFRSNSTLKNNSTRRPITAVIAVVALFYGVVHAYPDDEKATEPGDSKEAVATLAGGCFWCTEAVFERMEGVNDVVSGYLGGKNPNPNYDQVCTGRTGHAEAVEIYYDPSKVKYEELLQVFFKTHDPTTLNRQGADRGTQYRSAIFVHNEEQKQIAESYIKQLDASEQLPGPIVTTIEEASKFYVAEEYHQDYFRLNPNAG
ncbi:MAG: peptide-methionine (S)-S-oxide reductase MsrA, partial [Rubripirellula sp.]